MDNIVWQYLFWHFIDSPKNILKGWRNFLLFYLDYFSVPLLFKTFFSHWHKYYYSYGKGFSPSRFFEAFVFNAFSRIIGAILRTFFIILGIAIELIILILGAAVLIGWLLLPFLSAGMFVWGVSLIL